MTLIARTTDFTNKDFDSIRLRLQSAIQQAFPEWTDFNEDSFGNILIDLFSYVLDVVTFYQDNQARESRIATATQRKNIISLAKLLGYVPAGASAATVDVVISLPAPPTGSVTFPKGTVVSTLDITNPVAFQLLADAVIGAAANPASVTASVENSAGHEELFASTGLPNQSFQLSSTPYLDGSAGVSADNGSYTQVVNFLSSTATSRHYTVVVDQNDRATVRFGNGVNGQVPSGTIDIEYKTGGGTGGRVNAGTIKRIAGTFTDSLGNPVVPSVTNPEKSSGGTNRQTVEQIRALAPASIRASTNSVALEDFVLHAEQVPGVARALFLTSDQDPSVPENTGIAYVVPTGGGVPSGALLAAVLTQLTVTFPPTLTFRVLVQAAVYATVNVSAVVYLRQGANRAAVGASVRAALAARFAPQNPDGTPNEDADFGGNMRDELGRTDPRVALSELMDIVGSVAGVRRIGPNDDDFLANGLHQDVLLTPKQFPLLGSVQLVDGDVGVSI